MPDFADKTDQTLLDDFFRRRSEPAFTELVRRHQAMVFAAACRICGDRAEAQDVLQRVLIVLARKAGTLGEVKCLGAWLHRAAVLEAKKALRKSTNRKLRETMAYHIHEGAAEDRNAIRRIGPELDSSLDAMDVKDREVLTLHYLEGHSFKSIQQRLGGSAEAWQKRSVRALQKLAGRLKSRGATVSAVALAAYLSNTRAEAGVPPSILNSITRNALEAGTGSAAGIFGKAVILLTMKTGIAISLISGVLLAYGWGLASRTATLPSRRPAGATADFSPGADAGNARRPRNRIFTLEMVRQAVNEYDQAEKPDSLAESRLTSLMFMAPQNALEEILRILLATKDHSRFQQVAAALFACWAEYDPEAALARAQDADDFSQQARRAVMVTWLNQDAGGALRVILAERSADARDFLSEFVNYQCERKPQEAARLVDRVVAEWPEAGRSLFELVAKLWARTEPLAAGDWAATYPEPGVRHALLKSMAVEVAKIRGFDGLEIAGHIEDPGIQQKARNEAIYWWAITTGGISLIPGHAAPVRDLSGGFPDDWTDENIRTFAFSTMVNYSTNLPDLVKIAKDDGQRLLIYEGALKGSGWSNPAAVTQAAEQLPDSFATTPDGRETLKVFIRRWNEMDPGSAAGWLDRQKPGPKSEIMRGELKTGKSKQ